MIGGDICSSAAVFVFNPFASKQKNVVNVPRQRLRADSFRFRLKRLLFAYNTHLMLF